MVNRFSYAHKYNLLSYDEIVALKIGSPIECVAIPQRTGKEVGLVINQKRVRINILGRFYSAENIPELSCKNHGEKYLCYQYVNLVPGEIISKDSGEAILHSRSGDFLLRPEADDAN